MVSCLTFKSFSHFEFILVHSVRVCSNLFICMQLSRVPAVLAEKTVFFPFFNWVVAFFAVE